MSVSSREQARRRQYQSDADQPVTGITRYNLIRRAKKLGNPDPESYVDKRLTKGEVESELHLDRRAPDEYDLDSIRAMEQRGEEEQRRGGYVTDKDVEDMKREAEAKEQRKKELETAKTEAYRDEAERKKRREQSESLKRKEREAEIEAKKAEAKEMAKVKAEQALLETRQSARERELETRALREERMEGIKTETEEKLKKEQRIEDKKMRERLEKEYGIKLSPGETLKSKLAEKEKMREIKEVEEDISGVSKLTGWRKALGKKGGIAKTLAEAAEGRYGAKAKAERLEEEVTKSEIDLRRAAIAAKMGGIKAVEQTMALRRAEFERKTRGEGGSPFGMTEESPLLASQKPNGLLAEPRGGRAPGGIMSGQAQYRPPHPFLVPQQGTPAMAGMAQPQAAPHPFLSQPVTTRDVVSEFAQRPSEGPSIVERIRNGTEGLGMKREAQGPSGWEVFGNGRSESPMLQQKNEGSGWGVFSNQGRSPLVSEQRESPLTKQKQGPSSWDSLGGSGGGMFGSQKKRRGLI